MPEAGQGEADGPVNDTATTASQSNYETCERTGFRVLPGELKREWNGAYVRPDSWEPRHPQDMVRSRAEAQKGPLRPEPSDTFLNTITSGSLTALTGQVDPDSDY